MAYNYYTNPYNYQQAYQLQTQQQMPQQTQPLQIQNGGFVPIRSEQEARNYPVAPGNSVTFKDETAPYVYTKTMGFSSLDRPIFEKYRLIKEDAPDEGAAAENAQRKLEDEIDHLWTEINTLKKSRKKEVTE